MVTFIGPTLLSGIGQMLHKYLYVFPDSKYVELIPGQVPSGDVAVIFALPAGPWLELIPEIKRKFKKVHCMSICETETVHEDYGKLFEHFSEIIVASDFCKKVFSRQFPGTNFLVWRAHVPRPPKSCKSQKVLDLPKNRYVFYHMGNIVDPRKNLRGILEAFLRLNRPDETFLVLKATCIQPIEIKLPNVLVINGLIPEAEMECIHEACHCYVSFSNSEGIGMGAVEAALHSKPVIITDYGGAVEYIKTPYVVPCGLQEIPRDDFLFKKGMLWGQPSSDKLLEFMGHAFDNKVYYMEHTHTNELVGAPEIQRTCPFI
jgi:glycosyltransferase involved in cell wall biosynthesis